MLRLNLSQSHDAPFTRRLILLILLSTAGLYGLLTIAPFFMLGLHQQPVNLVMGGAFDPKYLPGLNAVVYTVGFLLIIIAPIVISIFAPLILMHSWRRWSAIPVPERLMTSIIGAGCVALLVFMFTSPLARLIMTWWLD